MNLNGLIQAISKMLPNTNLNEAVEQAQQIIGNTPNDLNAVRSKARELGINSNFVNEIYNKYGNTPVARMMCKMLGTSPEDLKSDALTIVGYKGQSNTTNKFPRL